MAGEDLIQQTKDAYEAFGRGDVDSAIALLADDVEWTNPGNSAVSGTFKGKDEVLSMWGRFGEGGATIENKGFASDGERVVAFTTVRAGDEEWDTADVFTFRDGKVVSFDGIEDTDAVERAFPK